MTSPIRTSESINEFAAALAKAQGQFKPVAKTRQGKIEGESKGTGKAYSFSYAYADIADVLEMALPIISANDIATMQPTVMDGNILTIVTRLTHASGQWMESDYPVCSIQGDHKKMGGALTYARRYALCTMLGIAPDEDIDGDGAEEAAPKPNGAARNENRRSSPRDDRQTVADPFDTPPAQAKDFEPAVSTKAIGLGREMKACKSIPDLNSFKKTPEWSQAISDINDADWNYLCNLNEQIVKDIESADLRMAG